MVLFDKLHARLFEKICFTVKFARLNRARKVFDCLVFRPYYGTKNVSLANVSGNRYKIALFILKHDTRRARYCNNQIKTAYLKPSFRHTRITQYVYNTCVRYEINVFPRDKIDQYLHNIPFTVFHGITCQMRKHRCTNCAGDRAHGSRALVQTPCNRFERVLILHALRILSNTYKLLIYYIGRLVIDGCITGRTNPRLQFTIHFD